MLSIELAQELKQAGVRWTPAIHDFFIVPNADLDDRLFVLTDMMASIAVLKGWPAITFNGVVEWALDYILTGEATWVPTEAQLRELVAEKIDAQETLSLVQNGAGCVCQLSGIDAPLSFHAETAANAYALALLNVLQRENGDDD
jgi:hypothetical protein